MEVVASWRTNNTNLQTGRPHQGQEVCAVLVKDPTIMEVNSVGGQEEEEEEEDEEGC